MNLVEKTIDEIKAPVQGAEKISMEIALPSGADSEAALLTLEKNANLKIAALEAANVTVDSLEFCVDGDTIGYSFLSYPKNRIIR